MAGRTQSVRFSMPFVWLLVPLVAYILVAYYADLTLWNDPKASSNEQSHYFRVLLTDFPAEKAKSVCCNAQLLHQYDSVQWVPMDGQIKLYLQKDSLARGLQQGDILVVKTVLRQSAVRNPSDFDYAEYLRLTGFVATAYAPTTHWERVAHEEVRGFRARAVQCRHLLYQTFRRIGLRGDALAIVSALTLGYTEDLTASTRQSFNIAGAAHILAVSGMHTAIIYAVLWLFFTCFGLCPILYHQRRRRIMTTGVIIVALWFYAFIAGATPSILRSVIMLSIYAYGKCQYYPTNTYNILAAAACIELLVYPLHLFTASFLLSYAAVLAIVYLNSRWQMLYQPRTRVGKYLYELLTVSVAAQIGTLPFCLLFFGQTSNYFALTNLTILPLSYVIMALAVPALCLQAVPEVGVFFATLLARTTDFTLAAVQTIEHLPHSVSHLQTNIPLTLLFITAIVCACCYFRQYRMGYLLAFVLCVVSFVGVYAWQIQQISQQQRLVVFSSRPHTTILYQQGLHATLMTNDSVAAMQTTAAFRRYNHIHQVNVQLFPEGKPYSFAYKGKQFLILDSPILANQTLTAPVMSDVLLVGNIGRISIARLMPLLPATEILALPTLSAYKTRQLQAYTQVNEILFQNINKSARIYY